MLYKKQISVGSFFKKGEDVKDGNTITIANEGKKVEGQFGLQDVFLIKLEGGEEGNITFNQTSINTLVDGYGEDSINWIGKKAKVMVVKMSVSGKIRPVYYFLHPDTILDEESGEFIIPNKSKESIPVIESDEIDPNEAASLAAEQDKI